MRAALDRVGGSDGVLPDPERENGKRFLDSAVHVHVAALRAGIDDACCSTALAQQCLVFRSLSEILTIACSSAVASDAVYDVRRSCLDYFDAVERGTKIGGSKRIAQISVDLLEAALLAAPTRGARILSAVADRG